MRWFRKLERRLIPNLRTTKTYKRLKMAIAIPFILPIYYIKKVFTLLIGVVKIKRKNKPDIVLENIINGWVNLIIPNSATERVALYRAEICSQCPSAQFSSGIHTIVVDNKTTHVRGLKCGVCDCPLSAKVRSSNDYCPLGKW